MLSCQIKGPFVYIDRVRVLLHIFLLSISIGVVRITVVYGDFCSAYVWSKVLRQGRESLEGSPHEGGPVIVTTSENIMLSYLRLKINEFQHRGTRKLLLQPMKLWFDTVKVKGFNGFLRKGKPLSIKLRLPTALRKSWLQSFAISRNVIQLQSQKKKILVGCYRFVTMLQSIQSHFSSLHLSHDSLIEIDHLPYSPDQTTFRY